MKNEDDLKTFLYIGNKEFSLSIKEENKDFKIFKKNIELNDHLGNFELTNLDEFLNDNIFDIEKSFKSFLKNIVIIIDNEDFLDIKVSLKKKNYGKNFDKNDLSYLLKDAKNQIKENYDNLIITHMIITKYSIDDELYSFLPINLKCDTVCVEVNFICFSESFYKKLEKVLNKYQIKIQQILSAKYIKNYFKDDLVDIFKMSQKIIDGHNKNEVLLISKTFKNKGFFEKFFNFFS